MQSHCYLAEIQCELVFKSVTGSDIVGVWWVNPAQPSQQLHLGQYHYGQHAWYDVSRRFGQLYVSDAQCLQNRPAIALKTVQVAYIRAYAQTLWRQQRTQMAA